MAGRRSRTRECGGYDQGKVAAQEDGRGETVRKEALSCSYAHGEGVCKG